MRDKLKSSKDSLRKTASQESAEKVTSLPPEPSIDPETVQQMLRNFMGNFPVALYGDLLTQCRAASVPTFNAKPSDYTSIKKQLRPKDYEAWLNDGAQLANQKAVNAMRDAAPPAEKEQRRRANVAATRRHARRKATLTAESEKLIKDYQEQLDRIMIAVHEEQEQVRSAPGQYRDPDLFEGGLLEGMVHKSKKPAAEKIFKLAAVLNSTATRLNKIHTMLRGHCLKCNRAIPFPRGKSLFCSPACDNAAQQQKFRKRSGVRKTLR